MYLVFRYLKFIIAIVVLWAALFTWSTYGCHRVTGNHMNPTILDSEYKLFYKQQAKVDRDFNYGDLVLFYRYLQDRQGQRYNHIGRVIGLPGDRIKLVAGQLIRNGEEQPEKYLNERGTVNTPEIIVPRNTLYILSDNRQIQRRDSRNFGPIPEYLIRGKIKR